MNNSPLYDVQQLDRNLQPVLEKMSLTGFLVDGRILNLLANQVSRKLKEIEKHIFTHAGGEFNLNSSLQVAEVLFTKLKLPSTKQTQSGYSTNESVLKKIKSLHPVVPLIIEYRHLSKLQSTYLTSLVADISEDGRIHSTFLTEVASTGRLVSRNPNLQNIPVKDDLGNQIRKAFIAKAGCLILAADYSQVELRLLAYLSKEPKFIETFMHGDDIHLQTACEIFSKEKKEITEKERRIAKTVNFSIIYGISAYGLSDSLEIDYQEADYIIKTYFAKYPKIKEYLDASCKQVLELGYAETLGGIRKAFPNLKNQSSFVRKSMERMAVNYPVQGSAAEIIKLAMVAIDRELTKEQLQTKMLLQVHDELVFEVAEKELPQVAAIVKDKMENIVKLNVPIRVDIEVGPNWGEMKKYKIKI